MSRAESTRGWVSDAPERSADPEAGPGSCDDPGFDLDELHEFLAADLVTVPVDPAFKERLRRKLWSVIRSRCRGGGERPL